LHGEAVDFFGPVPTELFKRFEDGETGFFDAALNDPLATLVKLALDEMLEVLEVVPVFCAASWARAA
jgi:hypothetical protein